MIGLPIRFVADTTPVTLDREDLDDVVSAIEAIAASLLVRPRERVAVVAQLQGLAQTMRAKHDLPETDRA